uniref:Wsv025 n=1 Tax=Loa loa TaxID=7209 RepID=A0A1I7VJG3_LOALO
MSPSYIPSTIISPSVTTTITSSSSSSIVPPPPPYHTINLNTISCDTDIDVVGITDVARDVHLDDDDDDEQYDKPLDLSLKKREMRCLPSCSSVLKLNLDQVLYEMVMVYFILFSFSFFRDKKKKKKKRKKKDNNYLTQNNSFF